VAIPLLKTKLYIPPARPGLVSRPRLIERLDEGLRQGCKLTLVSAPAGFGKTTLLSEWIASRGLRARVAWVSLDEGDDDVARFWSYVISALQTLEPAIGQAALGALQDSQAQPLPLEPILTSLMNDIATLLPGDRFHILILDDYHVLAGDAGDATAVASHAIHESLDSLLDHLPPALRLVIASREDPPLALSLLRGRGQLNEIRADDLRFTPAETAELLNAVMGLGLSADDVAALEDRTEGWAVGLHLAALSLQGQSALEAHDFVSAFAGDDRYVADYLLDQVLDRQSPHIQRFLIQTSILDRLCGPLCDAVTAAQGTVIAAQGMPPDSTFAGSGEVLEYLERSGLFVVPLDNRRHWYRYHHLFADLLRSRLQAASGPRTLAEEESGEVATLHLRASMWYEEEGLIAEAVDHAFAAADYERAAGLIQRHYKETIWPGEWALVHKWLGALPETLIRSQPFLCLIYSVLSFLDSPERVEEWLHAAEEAWEAWVPPSQLRDEPVPRSVSDRDLFDANLLDIRATIAEMQGASSEEVIALTLQALERTPESVPSLRAAMYQRLGWCHLNLGDEGAAERFFHQAAKLSEIGGHPGNVVGATLGRAILAWRHGRLQEAATICRETLQSFVEPLERSGRRLPVAGHLYILLGRVLLELYELEAAESLLTRGVELTKLTMLPGYLLDGYHALACLRCIEQDFEGAFAWMEVAERTCSWEPESVCARRASIWLWQAQVQADWQTLDLALVWARGRDLESVAEDEWALPSLAQATIAGYRAYGKPDLAPLLGVLDEQLRLAEAANKTDRTIKLLIVEVLARQAMGQMGPAMALLERALALAAPHRYMLAFLRHGAAMEALLREAAARGISATYVDRLLSTLAKETSEPRPRQLLPSPPAPSLLEPLSKRELEVLRLLTSSLTGPEIADHLSISVGTFRSHTKSIYGKLGVHSRIEAIEHARDLELV
jgi:LuxR family maltose regulon positive regulatory protein